MGWLSTQSCLFLLASADRDYADAYPDLRDLGHQVELILRPDQEERTAELTKVVHFLPEKPATAKTSRTAPKPPAASTGAAGDVEVLLRAYLHTMGHTNPGRKRKGIVNHLSARLGISEGEALKVFQRACGDRKGGAPPLISKSTTRGKATLYFLYDEEEKRQISRPKKAGRAAPPEREVVSRGRGSADVSVDQKDSAIIRYLSRLGQEDLGRRQNDVVGHLMTTLELNRKQARAAVSSALDRGVVRKQPHHSTKLLFST